MTAEATEDVFPGNSLAEVRQVLAEYGVELVVNDPPEHLNDYFDFRKAGLAFHVVGQEIDRRGYYQTYSLTRPNKNANYDVFVSHDHPAAIFFWGAAHCGILLAKDIQGNIIWRHAAYWALGPENERAEYNYLSEHIDQRLAGKPLVLMTGLNIYTTNDPKGSRDSFVRRFHQYFQQRHGAKTCHLITKPVPVANFEGRFGHPYDQRVHQMTTSDLTLEEIPGYIYIPGAYSRSGKDVIYTINEKFPRERRQRIMRNLGVY